MVKQHDRSKSDLEVKQMVLAALLMFGFIAVASAEAPRSPVGKLMDPNGAVEYSRDGEKWRPVTRAKYLFSGYHVRTGADGSGNFINQESGLAQSLSANVTAMVVDADAQWCEDDSPLLDEQQLKRLIRAHRDSELKDNVLVAAYKQYGSYRKAADALIAQGVESDRWAVERAVRRGGGAAALRRSESSLSVVRDPGMRRQNGRSIQNTNRPR